MKAIGLTLAAAAALACAAPSSAAAQSLSNPFGCEASGGKQETGALLGAAAGALLGSQLSKNERALGAIGGAALGAAAGSYIGCRMQSSDAARAEAATKKALADGTSQSWSNPQTGASGRIDVLGVSWGAQPISGANFSYAPGVASLASYEPTGGRYYATGKVNLRATPSTKGKKVGSLAKNQVFDALGRAPGQPWLLVGLNGRALGYVSESLARSSVDPSTAPCRLVQASLNTPQNGATSQRYSACRDTRGEWALTPV